MSASFVRFLLVPLACASLAACSTRQVPLADPVATARAEWSSALNVAAQESSAGRHAIADRALADYAARFPASADAAEANYWRALYKLDPANTSATPRDAAVLLDSYLASPMIARRTEALTMRRLVAAVESRSAPSTPSSVVLRPEALRPEDRTKDEEIARLKEELARVNAELERIRRRLAQPRP